MRGRRRVVARVSVARLALAGRTCHYALAGGSGIAGIRMSAGGPWRAIKEELFHPVAGQPVEVPFRQMARANPLIDLLGLPVPIETGPLHARAAAVVRESNAMAQQRRTD